MRVVITDLDKPAPLPFCPCDWYIFFGFSLHKEPCEERHPERFWAPGERDLDRLPDDLWIPSKWDLERDCYKPLEVQPLEKKIWSCLVLREQILNYNYRARGESQGQTMDYSRLCGMKLEGRHRIQVNQGFGLLWRFLVAFGLTSGGPGHQGNQAKQEEWFKVPKYLACWRPLFSKLCPRTKS